MKQAKDSTVSFVWVLGHQGLEEMKWLTGWLRRDLRPKRLDQSPAVVAHLAISEGMVRD